jgi:glycosyltransferase involved in cell wall biosynthesis
MNKAQGIKLSVVIPLYNEAENLPELYKQITASCGNLDIPFEMVLVDDGSTDNSFQVLKELEAGDPRLKIIRLRRNFGQTAALSAGFDYARGEIIITLDADLQNDPGDFPLLIGKIEEGYDIVSGWRLKRKDKLISRRLPSVAANWIISRITKVKLHDYGCTLKAFRKDIVKNIKLYGEMHRFIPAIASTMGVTIAEVRVNHRPRIHGKSKYNISKSIRVFLDLLTVKFLLTYSTRPLQAFGLFGLIMGGIGGILALILSYQRLILRVGISNRPLLLLAILLIVIGFQFITMGLLGEIMVRSYHETAEKHIYVIREVVDSEREDEP